MSITFYSNLYKILYTNDTLCLIYLYSVRCTVLLYQIQGIICLLLFSFKFKLPLIIFLYTNSNLLLKLSLEFDYLLNVILIPSCIDLCKYTQCTIQTTVCIIHTVCIVLWSWWSYFNPYSSLVRSGGIGLYQLAYTLCILYNNQSVSIIDYY